MSDDVEHLLMFITHNIFIIYIAVPIRYYWVTKNDLLSYDCVNKSY